MDTNLVVINDIITEWTDVILDPHAIKLLIENASDDKWILPLFEVERQDGVATDDFNFSSMFNTWKIKTLQDRTMRRAIEAKIDRSYKVVEQNNDWEFRVYIQIRDEPRDNDGAFIGMMCHLF